jgi:hypothetical protein
MEENVQTLRDWAQKKARFASSLAAQETLSSTEKPLKTRNKLDMLLEDN